MSKAVVPEYGWRTHGAAVAVLRIEFRPPDWKKYCVPYLRVSFSVTSAMVASMRT